MAGNDKGLDLCVHGTNGQFSFQSQRKARPKQVFKLPHNCTHLTCWQSNAQNSPSQASTVREL